MTTDTPAAAAITAEREAFEVWVKTLETRQLSGRDDDGHAFDILHGHDGQQGCAWLAWQARARLSAPVAAPLADIPDAELPGMWERADFMGGQDEAQPAASGVDALWVESAMRLAEELETAAILYGDSKPESEREGQCCERMLAAREAMRAHLSTALKGAA